MSNEFKTVPVVPTEAMMKAATVASVEGDIVYVAHTSEDWERFGKRSKRIMHIYNAMLAAAPDHAGEVVYMLETDAERWEEISQNDYNVYLYGKGCNVRKFYTAPPRVVDVELAAKRVVAAFEANGKANNFNVNIHRECEQSMLALKAALEQTK